MVEDFNEVLNNFKSRCVKYYSESQSDLILKALDFACEKHSGQKRMSGEPYVIHPIAVANIIIDLGLDNQTVCAALLHDTIEDTDTTENEIGEIFGNTIKEMVLGVTKLKKISFKSTEE
ncbi:MAG: HD domain-containing protein [Clostridia bacterium]|nr:HD domain-containing protein [Clostridia bacterium]